MSKKKEKKLKIADKQVSKGQYTRALTEYLRVLEEHPHDIELLTRVSELQLHMGFRQEASETLFRLGMVLAHQENHLKAVATFHSVLRLDPGCVDAHRYLADLFIKVGMVSDAKKQLEILAGFYEQQGVTGDSFETYRRLVELDPENVPSLLKLAEMYASQQMIPQAIPLYARAASLLKEKGRLNEYVKVIERQAFYEPQNLEILKELANIFLQLNDVKKALAKLQVALRLAPRDLDVLEMLCKGFQMIQQPDKAVHILKLIADVHRENYHMDKVMETYQRVLKLNPIDVDARTFLAT
jgi:pilus assembly protein FimV